MTTRQILDWNDSSFDAAAETARRNRAKRPKYPTKQLQ